MTLLDVCPADARTAETCDDKCLFPLGEQNLPHDRLADQFHAQGYVPVRGFLTDPLLSIAFRYLQLKEGTVKSHDEQVPGTLSLYGDALMESILDLARPAMERITGLKLWPTYAYCRLYKTGDVLKPHRDRPECEISATLSLGHDLDEIHRTQPDYAWPIYMDGTPVVCMPGDMAVYKGCEVKHWRDSFQGTWQAQAFLHYVDREKPAAELRCYDGRPALAWPATKNRFPQSFQHAIADLNRQARSRQTAGLHPLQPKAQLN